jgi:hypothetical protein
MEKDYFFTLDKIYLLHRKQHLLSGKKTTFFCCSNARKVNFHRPLSLSMGKNTIAFFHKKYSFSTARRCFYLEKY